MAATGARNTPFSLIGGDVVVTGNIAATVDLHIDGRIDGDTACAALVQGPDSVIRGGVTAKTARIAGRVEGAITADDLVILATARVTGDCTYGRLQIEAGAQVDGRLASREGEGRPELKVVAG